MTNLERLNELLKDQDIPDFRKTVSPTLNNLKWLRHILLTREIPAELKLLLEASPKVLAQEYVP